jgi:branched-chain amino acid transport system permease protein
MKALPYVIGAVVLAVVPFFGIPEYYMHLLIVVLIWGFTYTGWSLMGRFRLVSLGHGAFMGIGAYTVAMLWNYLSLTPWLGFPIAMALTVVIAVLIGYPCFRFRIVGHYFALVTLALSEVVRMTVIALRDHTGGSLGLTPIRYGDGTSIYAFQFADKDWFYWIALMIWAIGILIWKKVDRSMERYALEAISEDEDAAASVGIHVTRQKLRITVISALMTAVGGVLYGQYQMYIAPETVSGVGVSLQIVFAVVAGGMYVAFGPTVGAIITLLLAETLRIIIGMAMVGLDTTIYGLMLILFIIFLPQGVLGAILERWTRKIAAQTIAASARAGGAPAAASANLEQA